VRASATSRLAPPAGFHAARSDSNTPKTDEASPFALLVSAAAPPAQKPSNTPGGKSDDKPEDGKTTPDQASAAQTTQSTQNQSTQNQPAAPASNSQPSSPPANDSDQDEDDQVAAEPNAAPVPDQADLNTAPLPPVSSDTQPVSNADDDIASDTDNVGLWPQSARPQPQTGQAGKPVKADKTEKGDKKDGQDQLDTAAVVATDLLPPDLQLAAVTPPPAPQAIVPPITDAPDQTEIAAAPAIAPATGPAAPQPADQIAPPSPDASQTANQDAAQAASPAAPQLSTAGTPPAPKPISSVAAAAANAGTDQDNTDQPQLLPKDAPAIAPAKGQPKPVAAKTDTAGKTAKPASDKPQQLNDPAAVKSADATTSTDDTDDSKPDTIKSAAPATDATAPKLATNITNTIVPAASPQVAPQAQVTDFTQHIQVTTQPHEASANLPALAVDIVAKSLGGAKQFDIRLDPPELGRVEVRLSIDATGKASAHLSADQPQTLTLLQKDASVLTRALRDAGLDVSQNGLNFSLRQQSGQDTGAGANPGGRRSSGRSLSLTATSSIEATAASAAYSGAADGHLDIRV